jgi:hypothetical protein
VKAFEVVVLVVCVGSLIVSFGAFVRAGKLYDRIGQFGSQSMTSEGRLSGDTQELIREEVRQTVAAIDAARQRRGQATTRSP